MCNLLSNSLLGYIGTTARRNLKKVIINNYRSIIYGVFLCYFLFYCFLAVDNFFFAVQDLRFVRAYDKYFLPLGLMNILATSSPNFTASQCLISSSGNSLTSAPMTSKKSLASRALCAIVSFVNCS